MRRFNYFYRGQHRGREVSSNYEIVLENEDQRRIVLDTIEIGSHVHIMWDKSCEMVTA